MMFSDLQPPQQTIKINTALPLRSGSDPAGGKLDAACTEYDGQ